MKVSVYNDSDQLVCTLDDDSKMLGYYPVADMWSLRVTDMNPHRVKGQFTDLSLVDKYEMTEDDYEKRTGEFAFV
jgi:tubulin-folding cofactor B